MKLPKTDNDRRRIFDSSTRTLLEVRKRGGIADLLEAVDLRDPAHPRAADYDPDRSAGPSAPVDEDGPVPLTSVEAAALDDRVSRDRTKLDTALAYFALGDGLLDELNRYYPRAAASTPPDPRMCPVGMCKNHWRAGIFTVPNHPDVYRDLCRYCGDWQGRYGRPCPEPVLAARELRGKFGVTSKVLAEHAPYALDEKAS